MPVSHVVGLVGWFWLNVFWVVAFPVILYLRTMHVERLRRGVINRFLRRRWGPDGALGIHLFLFLLITTALVTSLLGHSKLSQVEFALYWTIQFAWTVVDYITGGDEPGRRLKKLVSALVKKLRVAPSPRPAINLRMGI